MRAEDNPILNTPYAEPERHYATDTQGNLNYRDVRVGRRVFAPDVPQVPIGQQAQGSMFDLNDLRGQFGEHLVNQLREQDWVGLVDLQQQQIEMLGKIAAEISGKNNVDAPGH